MDRPIPKRRRLWPLVFAVVGAAIVTLALVRARATVPSVERKELLLAQVKRENVVRLVTGPGRLVPTTVRWITATHRARVEQVLVRSGDRVTKGQVVAVMRNPEMNLALLEAERQLALASVEAAGLRRQLDLYADRLEMTRTTLGTQHERALRDLERARALHGENLVTESDLERAGSTEEELRNQLALTEQQRARERRQRPSDLSPARDLEKAMRRIVEHSRKQLEELTVRAETGGVVQLVNVEPGQWVESGFVLAKIIVSEELKAELQIDELQARDVALDQLAYVSAGSSRLRGRVSQIDPSASQGTVVVELMLEESAPGLRPDQRISGEIEVRRYSQALTLKAPVQVTRPGLYPVFKLVGPDALVRTNAQLAPAAADRVLVQNGLAEGDQVVVGDMERFKEVERLAIE